MFVCSSGCSAGMALQEGQAVLLEVPLGNGLLSQAEGQLWIPCSQGNQGDIAQFTVPWASREHPAPCQPHSSLAFQYFIIISIKKPLPFILCNFFFSLLFQCSFTWGDRAGQHLTWRSVLSSRDKPFSRHIPAWHGWDLCARGQVAAARVAIRSHQPREDNGDVENEMGVPKLSQFGKVGAGRQAGRGRELLERSPRMAKHDVGFVGNDLLIQFYLIKPERSSQSVAV